MDAPLDLRSSSSVVLPLDAQHQAIEAAADAEEADAVAGAEELALLGEGGGQGQRDSAHIAEERVGGVFLLGRDAQGAEDGIAVAGADLVADDLVNHFV